MANLLGYKLYTTKLLIRNKHYLLVHIIFLFITYTYMKFRIPNSVENYIECVYLYMFRWCVCVYMYVLMLCNFRTNCTQ